MAENKLRLPYSFMMTVMIPTTLTTGRLKLRPWKEADFDAFAAMSADPVVMEYLMGPLNRAASDAAAEFHRLQIETHGFGFWALEVPGVAPFIGMAGLNNLKFSAPFTPAIEIGWRLARDHWGMGYATEAANAALSFGFETLGLDEIVALTVPANEKSQRVMQRIGMVRNRADDFDHPGVPDGHRLKRHVLYRITPHTIRP